MQHNQKFILVSIKSNIKNIKLKQSNDIVPFLDLKILVTVVKMSQEVHSFHFLQFLKLVVSKVLGYVWSFHLLLNQCIPVESFEKIIFLYLFESQLGAMLHILLKQLGYQFLSFLVFHEFGKS